MEGKLDLDSCQSLVSMFVRPSIIEFLGVRKHLEVISLKILYEITRHFTNRFRLTKCASYRFFFKYLNFFSGNLHQSKMKDEHFDLKLQFY